MQAQVQSRSLFPMLIRYRRGFSVNQKRVQAFCEDSGWLHLGSTVPVVCSGLCSDFTVCSLVASASARSRSVGSEERPVLHAGGCAAHPASPLGWMLGMVLRRDNLRRKATILFDTNLRQ